MHQEACWGTKKATTSFLVKADKPTPKINDPRVWPQPFWTSGANEILLWDDDAFDSNIFFQATLVEPCGDGMMTENPASTIALGTKLPLLVYFAGVGSSGGLSELRLVRMRRCVNRPFVLVAPVRQKGMEWWVLTKSGDWGWVEGDLNAARIQLFSAWIQHLGEDAGIDAGQISLFGYSAGAYAATEIFASGAFNLQSLIVAGVHGHGQPDLINLDAAHVAQKDSTFAKWKAFMKRLRMHRGAFGGVFIMHSRLDKVCPWEHVQQMFAAIDCRQRQLHLTPAKLEEITPGLEKKSNTAHNYVDQAFLRAELWAHIFPDMGEAVLAHSSAATRPVATSRARPRTPPRARPAAQKGGVAPTSTPAPSRAGAAKIKPSSAPAPFLAAEDEDDYAAELEEPVESEREPLVEIDDEYEVYEEGDVEHDAELGEEVYSEYEAAEEAEDKCQVEDEDAIASENEAEPTLQASRRIISTPKWGASPTPPASYKKPCPPPLPPSSSPSANGFNKISIGGLPTDKWVEVKRANAQGSGSRRSLVSKAIDGDEAEQESRERQLHKKRKHTRDDGDPGADTVWY